MSFTDRLLCSVAKSRDLDRPAMRALMKATELLGLASGLELVRLRESHEPLQQAYGQVRMGEAGRHAFGLIDLLHPFELAHDELGIELSFERVRVGVVEVACRVVVGVGIGDQIVSIQPVGDVVSVVFYPLVAG